ncbi:MAG: 30S ribosomal protein S7 [Patescibacteria group bacterium]
MRRKVTNRKLTEPDVQFNSVLVAKIISQVMRSGKKSIAERIVYGALKQAETQLKKPALEVLELAIENAGPKVELKSRRIGGANYQVPYEITPERKLTLALRWMIGAARSGKGKPMETKLFEEFVNAVNNTGVAVKKKLDMHRMADANKAFAHFAW